MSESQAFGRLKARLADLSLRKLASPHVAVELLYWLYAIYKGVPEVEVAAGNAATSPGCRHLSVTEVFWLLLLLPIGLLTLLVLPLR